MAHTPSTLSTDVVAELLTLKDQITDWGIGSSPLNELPDRPSVFTPESLRAMYEPMEKVILDYIKPIAEANYQRVGFNTDPRSIITITVDPADEPKLYKR